MPDTVYLTSVSRIFIVDYFLYIEIVINIGKINLQYAFLKIDLFCFRYIF